MKKIILINMKADQRIAIRGLALLCLAFSLIGCTDEWLDAKPNKNLVVPNTVADYQALLDNTYIFNTTSPGVIELASDDYQADDALWLGAYIVDQATYVWAADPFQGEPIADWDEPYRRILLENIVLEGLNTITEPGDAYNHVKGTALFFRAFDFYTLAQTFCKVYDASTADTDLGIPLRLTANVNEVSVRATVAETYDQILADLKSALPLLPQEALYKTRPSISAAYAMLARVSLSMEDYDNAMLYADSCLQLYNYLMDYNEINVAASRPFALFNEEVIFQFGLATYGLVTGGTALPELFAQYHQNDLRGVAFFGGTHIFKGSYNGSWELFNGLATDEVYLIRAESRARLNDVNGAMNDLNTLMANRWNNGVPFPTFTATDATDALTQILAERRKELCFRGLRWSDLRRLNRDPRFATTLSRTVDGQTYTLPPNDLRYVFPIPENEILGSGIEQNPR